MMFNHRFVLGDEVEYQGIKYIVIQLAKDYPERYDSGRAWVRITPNPPFQRGLVWETKDIYEDVLKYIGPTLSKEEKINKKIKYLEEKFNKYQKEKNKPIISTTNTTNGYFWISY